MIFRPSIIEQGRLSDKEKRANNFEKVIDIMEDIAMIDRSAEEIRKLQVNYDLFNGMIDVKLYDDPICFDVKTETGYETLEFDHQNISHTPLISQIGNTYVGEERNKYFNPRIKDLTSNRRTILKEHAKTRVQKFLMDSIIGPTREAIMVRLMGQAGVSDPFQLAPTPEIQIEVEQVINELLRKELPEDIMEFMNGDFQAPTARQAQRMFDFLKETHDIKWEGIMGKKHAVITGEEIYFAGDYNGMLQFSAINPMYFIWGSGRKSDEWIQNADWAKRTDWLSYTQLISKHSKTLSESELSELETNTEPTNFKAHKGPTPPFWGDNPHTKKLIWTYSQDQGLQEAFGDIDIKTPEGQQKLFRLYDVVYGRDQSMDKYSDIGIREDHICVRLSRKMFIVTRQMPDGTSRDFYVAEHYEPTLKDLKVKEVWKEQIWEAWRLGSFNEIYTNVRPIPFQYKSFLNLNKPDLPYYGKKYNTHGGTTKNRSMIDMAKSSQKMFDTVLASIKKDLATDIGPVFMMFMNLKPKDWKYQEWLDFMRNAGIMWIDPKNRSLNGVDPQFLREVNLSKMGAIAGKIEMLQFWKGMVSMNMFFSDAREQGIGQYANAENVLMTNQAVHNKTGLFEEQHRLIFEKALGGFLNRARHYYRENPQEAAAFLDDVELADLMSSPAWYYEAFGLELKNSEAEEQKLNMIKQQALTFVQNGSSPESIMRLILADTQSDVNDILRSESRKLEQQKQVEFERQQQLQQQQIQAEMANKQEERMLKLKMHMDDLASKERRSAVESRRFQLQADVDNNNMSDLLEGKILELKQRMAEHNDKMDLEREKLALKEKLGEEPRI